MVDLPSDGEALVISGLWTLTLGGGAKSTPDTIYLAAGPNTEMDGLFGSITPVPGGVGPMTIACLLHNTLAACKRRRGLA